MAAAAMLNLFLVASLNMSSLEHSLPYIYFIMICTNFCANISIHNWVVGTWW